MWMPSRMSPWRIPSSEAGLSRRTAGDQQSAAILLLIAAQLRASPTGFEPQAQRFPDPFRVAGALGSRGQHQVHFHRLLVAMHGQRDLLRPPDGPAGPAPDRAAGPPGCRRSGRSRRRAAGRTWPRGWRRRPVPRCTSCAGAGSILVTMPCQVLVGRSRSAHINSAATLTAMSDRNREADALGTLPHRHVDADHLAVDVHQRPARVAGIDAGIGLDQVLVALRIADLHACDAER